MRNLLMILFTLLAVQLNGQLYEFTTVGSIKDQKFPVDIMKFREGFYGIESSARSKFGWTITLDKIKVKCTLQAYDDKMNLVKETPLGGGKEAFGPFAPFLKMLNGKLWMLYYNYTDKSTIEVYCSPVNTTDLTVGEGKKVLEVSQKNVGLFKAMSLYQSNHLLIETSTDNSKLLFFWYSGMDNAYSFSVTDAAMKTIRSGREELDGADDLIVNNACVDNSGNFFAGYTYKKKDNYHSGIFANTGGLSKKMEITIGEDPAHDVFVNEGTTDAQIRVYGTYSKDGYYINGMFIQSMDKKQLKVSNQFIKEVPQELIEKFADDGFARTKKKGNGLSPQVQFVTNRFKDGTVSITGDLTRYQTTGRGMNINSTGVKGTTLHVFFKENSITVKRIPKKEAFGMEQGNNFYLHQWGEKLVMFYTDEETNVNTPVENAKSISFTSRKKNVLVAALIEKDGTITRKILYPAVSGSFYFSPDDTNRINDDTILFGLGKDKTGLTSIKTTSYFHLLHLKEE